MNQEKIIKQFKRMPWEVWLSRRFSPFVTYLIMKGATRAAYRTQSIDGEYPIALYDTDDWYECDDMFSLGAEEAETYLKQKDIFQLTRQCEETRDRANKIIAGLCELNGDPMDALRTFVALFESESVFAWVAHGSEPIYHRRIRDAVAEYVSEDKRETFIGDISFPSKKNALAQMEDDIRNGVSLHVLHARYGWMKARGGFLPGYTIAEMQEIQGRVLSESLHPHQHPPIPNAILPLVQEVQELVYLRTLRTDALWEMCYLANPIFAKVEVFLGIDSVVNYISDDLLAGKIELIPHEYAILKYHEDIVVVRESIMPRHTVEATEVHGVVAQKGKATGIVRILYTPNDIYKVADGDILVTNMTVPAYVSAMHRAAAFVTNEGGITCHAAILAREMKKPCVIGTKIATHIFADGDMVEVDAEKGIVRKI